MNRLLKRYTLGLTCLAAVSLTSCDETSGDPTGHPEGLSPDSVNVKYQTPTSTWTVGWPEHNAEALDLVYYNEDVVIYSGAGTPRPTTWIYPFSTKMWQYVKKQYGDFGRENRLYVAARTADDHTVFAGTIFDAATSYRNVAGVTATAQEWADTAEWAMDAQVQAVATLVDGSLHGMQGTPLGTISGTKWTEIFQFDVYMALGMEADADRIYYQYENAAVDYPVADTHWIRDWYYPIYDGYGKGKVLNKFFELLAKHFPKNGKAYARDLNMGEFVYFWQAAAISKDPVDVIPLATDAFGWNPEWQAQFDQAKIDFKF